MIAIPGSKSYTYRAIVIGALAVGETILAHPLISEDTVYQAEAMQHYGQVSITADESADSLLIRREAGELAAPAAPLLRKDENF